MGKAAKFKKLRKLAMELPQVGVRKEGQVEIKRGSVCIAEGTLVDLAGNEIKPDVYYKFPAPESTVLNHDKKLKQAYNNSGMKGAAKYANAVIQYTQRTTK